MKQLKNTFNRFWKDESAQGATEYILLLVVVVALVIVFKDKIKDTFAGKVNELGGKIEGFNAD